MTDITAQEIFAEISAAPSKSISSLCDDDDDESKRNNYAEIYQALGLSGEDDERINLTRFRRIIAENLDVDSSFMYSRVFNAFDYKRNGFLTARELVTAISILLQGPFQAQVELGLRVYGKHSNTRDTPNSSGESENKTAESGQLQMSASVHALSEYTITRVDAILSIVESLQLSSPRARHTLTTDNREKAYHIGEDLVFIIYPKMDIDGDGVISLDDFSQACHEDPSLIQVFGQYLPKNTGVLPSSSGYVRPVSATAAQGSSSSIALEEMNVENLRPRSSSSRSSFEGIDYLKHSPLIGTMWGRQAAVGGRDGSDGGGGRALGVRKSEKLEPIQMMKPSSK